MKLPRLGVRARARLATLIGVLALCGALILATHHGSEVAQHNVTKRERVFKRCVQAYGWGSPELHDCMKGDTP